MSSSAVPNLYNYEEVFLKNCIDCHKLMVIFLGSINSQNTRQKATMNSVTAVSEWPVYTAEQKQQGPWN
jgi:hypothetical protein